ncbi:MAG: hypothetical protein JNM63_16150 [Spirochaetia bacterium]|nr:hypothetical protein [Spirochaetia bacterium]
MWERIRVWVNEYKFIPNAAEAAEFVMDQGAGGQDKVTLFHQGVFALWWSGFPALISLRTLSPKLDLSIAECPSGPFRNSVTRTFAASLYSGGKQKELARLFLLYLTSEEHNLQISENADQLPPMPSFRLKQHFLEHAEYKNEWPAHTAFIEKISEIGVPAEYSPYIQNGSILKLENHYWEEFASGLASAEDAIRALESRINDLMAVQISGDPSLRNRFDEACLRQGKIDKIRQEGGKVPLVLVDNPFLSRYYRDTGRGI